MLHLKTLLILAISFLALTYLVRRLKEESVILTTSVIFLVAILLFISFIGLFKSPAENGALTLSNAFDYLISFDTLSTKIRNSAVIVGLAAISYGLYDQDRLRKNILMQYSSYLLAGVTLALLIMMSLAGGFTL